MTTNRPFLSNFLAAFRAQSTFQHPVSPTPSQSGNKHHQSYSTAASTAPANTTHKPYNHEARMNAASKTSTVPTVREATTSSHTNSHTQASFQPSHRPHAAYWDKTPGSPNGPTSLSSPPGFPLPGSSSRHRRGSDSSSDGGFRERTGSNGGAGGAGSSAMEKWFIGGRTADGDERFYKLGMVRRIRSSDRLSLDRLSL